PSDADRRFHRRPDMATGTVKFFNSQKGFGFIQPDDGGKDVFVHISAVERAGMSNLNEGQKLTYDVVSERGKLAAANLQAVYLQSKTRIQDPQARPPRRAFPADRRLENGTEAGDARGICPVRRFLRGRLAALQPQGAE